MPRSIAALAAVAVLLLAGCAERSPAAPPPPTPTPSATSTLPSIGAPTPAPTLSAAPSAGTVTLTVHHGAPPAGALRGPEWLVTAAGPTTASVGIAWTDSVAPGCGAVQDAWVQETGTAVVIDLERSARRVGVVCPAVLVPRAATVTLAAPLGTRTLEEHESAPGSVGAPCPSPGPIARSAQVVCPLTAKP